MTTESNDTHSATASRDDQQRPVLSHRRSTFIAYALVAIASLAVGVGGTLVALRARLAPAATAAEAPWGTGVTPAGVTPGLKPRVTPGVTPGVAADPGGGPSGPHRTDARGNAVFISPARQQLVGVRTEQVWPRTLETTIRTVGTLAYDETRITQIHTKIAGWVERLYVDYVGKVVRRGEPLFTAYSPELVSTQSEYLLALEAQRRLSNSQFVETRNGAESLLAATRQRLKLWDITDEQIDELTRTREPQRTMTLYSPFTGVVLERNTFAGQYITPELTTFKLADLANIWVLGHIFKYELPLVKVGQAAEIQFPYGQSERALKGRITYIYPDVDPMTRRVKVRAEFPNAGFQLKPDSYVTVIVRAGRGEALAIPQEAVIDTGVKQYALLAHPDGYFEPRAIQVGPPVDGFYPLRQGLTPGDRVVTSAQFLIDSETNLQAALQSMAGHAGMGTSGDQPEGTGTAGKAPPAPPASEHVGHASAPTDKK